MIRRKRRSVPIIARRLAPAVAACLLVGVAGCDKPSSERVAPARPQPNPTAPTVPAAAPTEPTPESKVASTGLSERDKIERMLKTLEESDAIFIRNDVEHNGPEGAAHLRRKWERTGDRAGTAKDFIELLASTSSASGRPYQVKTSDGTVMASREWFLKLLEKIESTESAPRPGA